MKKLRLVLLLVGCLSLTVASMPRNHTSVGLSSVVRADSGDDDTTRRGSDCPGGWYVRCYGSGSPPFIFCTLLCRDVV